jgi:hypothetical protein
MKLNADWEAAIAVAHQRERRVAAYLQEVFPTSEPAFGSRSGSYVTKFAAKLSRGRRTWMIEVWESGDKAHAGLYILEQVKRHNYFWELAEGDSFEQAIDRLKLRINVLANELEGL